MASEVTRRRLFGQAGGAAVGLAGLGIAGGCGRSATGAEAPAAAIIAAGRAGSSGDAFQLNGYHQFITRRDLHPPVVKMARKAQGSYAENIFLTAAYSGPGFGGSMILDRNGDLVYMNPDTATAHQIDFNVQTYLGEPHLTWWEGVETHGWGQGVAAIADSTYTRKHTIHAVGEGIKLDHHEFNITPQNTALVTIFKQHTGVDLRPVGGPKNGVMVSGVFQEIDIATNKLIWQWDSLCRTGVPLTEDQPYRSPTASRSATARLKNPWDYFHINSLVVSPDGEHIIVSSRNTWTVYLIKRHTGQIVWKLGGRHSDFTMGPGAEFFWQHHVRLARQR